MEGRDPDAARELERRLRDLEEREAQLARGEARLQAAVETQKQQLRNRGAEIEADRGRRNEAAAARVQEASALQERARTLELREADLSARCEALERLVASGAAQGELLKAVRGLRESLGADPGSLAAVRQDAADREHALAAREQALRQREGELVRRTAQLAATEEGAAPAPPEPEPPAVVLQPPPQPPLALGVDRAPGRYNIDQLRGLIEAGHGTAHDDVAEWQAYVDALVQHARSDGSLPSEFDRLVEEVFGDLL